MPKGSARLSVVPTASTTALHRLVGDYIASCRARGLSPRSISAYEQPLRGVFLPWCADQKITAVDQLDQRALDRYSAHLLEVGGPKGPLSKHSVHAYVRPVRQLLTWARAEGEAVSGTPQLPKLPRQVVDTLSREEITRLEDAAVAERDRLIIRLMADTGMRVSDVLSLKVDAIHRDGRAAYLQVRGKGDVERLVPVEPKTVRRIERYQRGRPSDTRADRLFVSLRRGRDGDYEPLTRSGIFQLVRVAAERAGLPLDRVHPHALRHSFVTDALRRGVNPMLVAQVVGHSSLRMIETVYAHLTKSDAHTAIMKMLASDDD